MKKSGTFNIRVATRLVAAPRPFNIYPLTPDKRNSKRSLHSDPEGNPPINRPRHSARDVHATVYVRHAHISAHVFLRRAARPAPRRGCRYSIL